MWCVELHANLISAQVALTTLAGMSFFFSVREIPNSTPRSRSTKTSRPSEFKRRLFVSVWPSAATEV